MTKYDGTKKKWNKTKPFFVRSFIFNVSCFLQDKLIIHPNETKQTEPEPETNDQIPQRKCLWKQNQKLNKMNTHQIHKMNEM